MTLRVMTRQGDDAGAEARVFSNELLSFVRVLLSQLFVQPRHVLHSCILLTLLCIFQLPFEVSPHFLLGTGNR